MEQYMAKNARLEEWKSRDDKELGGIEGHQLMNRFDDHDVTNNYDSDSDLETCEPVVFAHMPTEVIDMKVLLQHRQLTRFMAANMPAGKNNLASVRWSSVELLRGREICKPGSRESTH
ncbi:uncharacterized protein [Physcomitrium patens]|uniref:uncharacterized protein n=1 Tax=Physcomitrium patens TaxID=3218 RepID=UPI003CCE1BFC